MAFAAMSVFMRQLQIQHQNARHAIVRHPHDMMVVALALLVEDAREHRRRRSCWLKPGIQRRPFLGQYDTFMRELMREARGDFKLYLRMTPEIFLEDCSEGKPEDHQATPPTANRAWPPDSNNLAFPGNGVYLCSIAIWLSCWL